ncbi:MAG: hypothetical protein JSW50_10575 [Candidatus Latescibacterota bacterium]|nr:MAG: hypothetical protein JSW50_10575 [Candidatus Latescibacterota bacterium]
MADSIRLADSTLAQVPVPPAALTSGQSFNPAFASDTLDTDTFHARHAFSLDHFFEGWPFYFLARRGPIGAATDLSRFGMGRGRCAVYLGNVSFNDPQDDNPPFAVVPTTPIGDLVFGGGGYESFLPDRSNVEGAFRIVREPPPIDKPRTFLEISRGDRGLVQRRVKFASAVGPVGIDIGYDETRNNGYAFDARGIVSGSNYGQTRTRIQSANVRGRLPTGEDYLFSFRRYTNLIDGDLVAVDRTHRRGGHVGLIETSFGRFQLSIFERTHKVDTPDSSTANLTTGAYLTVPVSMRPGRAFALGLGYENIFSRQEMRGVRTNPRIRRVLTGVSGSLHVGGGLVGRFDANLTHYLDYSTGWGGRVVLGRELGARNEAIVELRRGFRMPNLGELFLPRHELILGGGELEGNRYVKDESSLDASAGIVTRHTIFENEARVTLMRIRDPILYELSTDSVLRPVNGEREGLFVLEDRFKLKGSLFTVGCRFDGAVWYTPSERDRYFSSVPEMRTLARLGFGRGLFKNTSELWVTGEFEFASERQSGSSQNLPSYSVYNLKIDFRLLSAHIYLQWLNISDEKYVTVWPYLMTPNTFVYGIEWTLFE